MTRIAIPNRRESEAAYCWRTDAIRSWELAISMMALAAGSRRFASVWEMYWVEAQGGIP